MRKHRAAPASTTDRTRQSGSRIASDLVERALAAMGDKFRSIGRTASLQGETSSILDMLQRKLILTVVTAAALFANPWLPVHEPDVAHAQQQPAPASETQRIELLEERIKELQAVIGTLQSFVRDGAATAAPDAAAPVPGGGGAPSELSIRVLALETQMRALTEQMKDVLVRLDQAGGTPAGPSAPVPWQQGANEAVPQPQSTPAAPQEPAIRLPDPQFGAAPAPQQQTAQVPAPPAPPAPNFSGGGGARGIYDASYQSFVRNDLAGAEQGFKNFIQSFPDDPLTTNAYYWLGRTHFDRQQYEPAAKAFLAGYKRDKQGAIAPDSLLHLGLALSRLGETEAACSTLSAVPRQYPSAPEQLRQSATEAMKKARC